MTHFRSRNKPMTIRLMRSEIPMMDINSADSITLMPFSSESAGRKTGIVQWDEVNRQMLKQKKRKCKLRKSWKSNPVWSPCRISDKNEENFCQEELPIVFCSSTLVGDVELLSDVCRESKLTSLFKDWLDSFASFKRNASLKKKIKN